MKILKSNKELVDFFGKFPLRCSSLRVTMACNGRCKHCYSDAGKRFANEYSKDQIFKIIDQLVKMNIFQIFFTGGEPFLRQDMIEILNYADKKGIDILISTNGTSLTEEKIISMKHINFEQFQVSLDGIGDVHDENRGKGFFKRADRTINLLKKHKIKNITIGTCLTKYNVKDLPNILKYIINNKIPKFALMLLLPEGRANFEMGIEPKELLDNLEIFWNIYREHLNNITFEFASNSVLPPVFVPKDLRNKGVHKPFIVCCGWPNIMGIGIDGSVAPCDGFLVWKDFIGGNIYKNNIEEIWGSMTSNEKIIPKNVIDLKGVCKKCIFVDDCGGNCRADAVSFYNDIKAPYPPCQKLYEAGLFPKECLKENA